MILKNLEAILRTSYDLEGFQRIFRNSNFFYVPESQRLMSMRNFET